MQLTSKTQSDPTDEVRRKLTSLKQSVLAIFTPQLLCESSDAHGLATAALCWLIHEYEDAMTFGPDDSVLLREKAFKLLQTNSWGWIMSESRLFANYAASVGGDLIHEIEQLHSEIIGDGKATVREGVAMPAWSDSWCALAESALKRSMTEAEAERLRTAYANQASGATFLTPDIVVRIICPMTTGNQMLSLDLACLATDRYGWGEANTQYEGVVSFTVIGKEGK